MQTIDGPTRRTTWALDQVLGQDRRVRGPPLEPVPRGIFLTTPLVGPVIIGIPKDSLIKYEQAVKTAGCLVGAQGSAQETTKSETILEARNPSRVDLHENLKSQDPAPVQTITQTASKRVETRFIR